MKIYKNSDLKTVKKEDIKNFEDVALLIESCSETYKNLLHRHFEYQKMREDGIWKEVYPTVETISKKAKCNEKTVDRFNSDLSAVVHHRRRWKGGKQTSNVYQMNKIFYQYMKAFWRLGLFKEGNPFQIWWEWIKKLWLDCNCDHLRFMNKVWNYKSPKSNSLDGTSEQPSEKMSLGENGKCPSSFNPLSEAMKICTDFVPSSKIQEMEAFLLRKTRDAINDLKWYAVDQKRHITNHVAFFTDALRRAFMKRKNC